MDARKFAESVNYWASKTTKGYGTWQWLRDLLNAGDAPTQDDWREAFMGGMSTYTAFRVTTSPTDLTEMFAGEVRDMLNHCAEQAGLGHGVVK